mmetsp:Transcript_41508/g.130923  ORF Transcript_41508/g.130923 Transcript_41508/m.130923 type:complete len:214 (+) Transcript_41508:57-698(+)
MRATKDICKHALGHPRTRHSRSCSRTALAPPWTLMSQPPHHGASLAGWGTGDRLGARGRGVRAALRLLRGAARVRRVPRHHRRLRHRRLGHRHRALRTRLWRGGLQGVPRARSDPARRAARMPSRRGRTVQRRGTRMEGAGRQGGGQAHHFPPQGAGAHHQGGRHQPLVPLLLALGHASHLPRRPWHLRGGRGHQGEADRQQQADVLGAGPRT